MEHHFGTGSVILKFTKQLFSSSLFSVLLLYRKRTVSLAQFFSNLSNLVAHEQFEIVLGDFNIDAFQTNQALNEVMLNYVQLVTQPTHLSGSLLDHVYVHKNLLSQFEVNTTVLPTYFSDHDAVKLQIIHN